MAKKIAIINYKGGVGKTLTAVNLSAAIGLLKKKVLLVDLDSQCNTSYLSGFDEGDGETIFDSMKPEELAPLVVYETEMKNVFLVPADRKLGRIDELIVTRIGRETILKDLISQVETNFDYVIYDCPPNRGIITVNAMAASDEIVIPVDSQLLALQGLGEISRDFGIVKSKMNKDVIIRGYLITKFKSNVRVIKDVVNSLKDNFPSMVFNTKIRENVKLAETPSARQSIFQYYPQSHGAEDYLQFARELTGLKTKTQFDPK